MKTKKYLFFILSVICFTSCSRVYQAKVNHIDGVSDTIIIRSGSPHLNEKDELISECGCDTYAYHVKSYSILKEVDPEKHNSIIAKTQLFVFSLLAVFALYLLIRQYLKTDKYYSHKNNNNKTSTMKKILTYVAYAVIIILSIKIGSILIQYLPAQIERLLNK